MQRGGSVTRETCTLNVPPVHSRQGCHRDCLARGDSICQFHIALDHSWIFKGSKDSGGKC